MDFGLGIILSCQNFMSSGLDSAAQSLTNLDNLVTGATKNIDNLNKVATLQATALASNQIGNGLVKAGSAITGTFLKLINKVRDTGQEYEDFGITLNAVYGDAKKADKAMKNLMDFSVKSPLEVGEVKEFLITLKSQGVEPFEKMKGSISGVRQETLAWLTDLKSFRPEVRSERFKMAIQNYVGSGEKKMMRTVFDMGDIEQVIGHKKGNTAQKRMEDIVEFVEKTKLTGLSDKLSKSWTGVASNIDDAFTKLFKTISDNGVFENLKGSFLSLSGVILSMPDKEIVEFGRVVADALNIVVTPLTKLVEWGSKGIETLVKLSKEHPKLVKMAIVLGTVAGGALLLSGVLMKGIGTMANFAIVMNMMGNTSMSVSNLIRRGFLTILRTVGPLALVTGGLYYAWTRDLLGIQTSSMRFVKNTRSAFSSAYSILNGSVIDMKYSMNSLQMSEDPWSEFTYNLTHFLGILKFVGEAWKDNTLSMKSYNMAKEMGILPAIESILIFKHHVEHFFRGFSKGLVSIYNKAKNFLGMFKNTPLEGVADKITNFFNFFNTGFDRWEKSGEYVGKFTASLIGLKVGGKILSRLINPFTKLFGVMSLFKKVHLPSFFGGKGKGGLGDTGSSSVGGGFLTHPGQVAKTMGSLAIIITSFTGVVIAYGLLSRVPNFNYFMSQGTRTLTRLFSNILPLAGGVGVLSVVIGAMTRMNVSPRQAVKGMTNFGIILGGMSLFIGALGALSKIPGVGSSLAMGSSMIGRMVVGTLKEFADPKVFAVLAGIALYGSLAPKRTIRGMMSLATVLGGMSLLVGAVSAVAGSSGMGFFVTGGVKFLSSVIGVLGQLSNPRVIATMVSVSLFGMVHPKTVLRGIESLVIVLGGMSLLVGAVSALTGISGINNFLTSGVDVLNSTISVLGSLGNAKVLLSLTSVVALGKVLGGSAAEACLNGMIGLATLLGGLEVVILAFGALAKIPNIQEFQNGGAELIASLFGAVGKAIGSFVGNVAVGVTGNLPQVGNNLSSFAKNITPFFSILSGVDTKGVGVFMSSFAKMIVALSADNAISSFFGKSDLPGIGKQLTSFADSAEGFFSKIATYDESGVEKAPKVLNAIAGVGAFEFRSGGLLQKLVGNVDLGSVGTQLSAFAVNGETFFNVVARYNEDGINKAPGVFKALSGIGDYDFKTGGLFQFFTGTTSFDAIGGQLALFAPSGTVFFNAVAGYNDLGITKAGLVFRTLSDMFSSEFRSGGLLQFFTGEVSLSKIGEELTSFAIEATGFFNAMANITPGSAQNANLILSALSGISGLETGGLQSLWNGGFDLGGIADELTSFAEKSKIFFTIAGNTPYRSVVMGKNILDMLKALDNSAFKDGGVVQFWTGSTSIGSIGTGLTSMANGLKGFFAISDTIKEDSMNKFISLISKLSGEEMQKLVSLSNTSNGAVINFGNELRTFADDYSYFVTTMGSDSVSSYTFDPLITSIKNFSGEVGKADTKVSTFVTNMTSKVTNMVTTIGNQLNRLSDFFRNLRLELPQIKLPHFNVSGAFNLGAGKQQVPKIDVDWYARGGVFSTPQIIGVGDAGKEAVVPLSQNAEWISTLTDNISREIPTPVVNNQSKTQIVRNTSSSESSRSQSVSSAPVTRDVDNRVIFEKGSIVINVKELSKKEIDSKIDYIKRKIDRKKEIKKTMKYGLA